MNGKSARNTLKIAMEKRILNEFGAKILNEERLDIVVESRRGTRNSKHTEMLFACECDDVMCMETISMSTEEYTHMHSKTKYFVVKPKHVRFDLEEVIESFSNYSLVGKFFPHPSAPK